MTTINTSNDNNTNDNNDIQNMIQTAQKVWDATNEIVSNMDDKDHISLQVLASKVSKAVSMEPKTVFGFVDHFVRNSTTAFISPGKSGGVRKGARPVKVVKPAKKSTK